VLEVRGHSLFSASEPCCNLVVKKPDGFVSTATEGCLVEAVGHFIRRFVPQGRGDVELLEDRQLAFFLFGRKRSSAKGFEIASGGERIEFFRHERDNTPLLPLCKTIARAGLRRRRTKVHGREGSLGGSLGAYEDVLITSEEPYAARIADIDIGSGDVVQHITFEGFEIGPAPGIVIKMDGGRTTNENVHHVTFRNNIIHESGSSDVVKINAGSNEIRLEWNVLYGHNDDTVDLNSVENVFLENNVFFDLLAERHRNLLVIKDSTPVGAPDFYESTRNAIVRGNVFFGWHGGGNSAMLALGEDNDRDAYAVQHALVENNVFIGDGALEGFVAPISMRGVRGVTVRHNTFTGPFAGARSWGFLAWEISEPSRILTEGIFIYNNVWAGEGVRASRFLKSDDEDVGAFVLDNNLYWNGGSELPFDGDQGVIDAREDSAAVRLDPGLPPVDGSLLLPIWQRGEGRFADGSTDICSLRGRLIDSYAQPTESSAVSEMGRSEIPSGDEFPVSHSSRTCRIVGPSKLEMRARARPKAHSAID
jgi:hypothetical protein